MTDKPTIYIPPPGSIEGYPIVQLLLDTPQNHCLNIAVGHEELEAVRDRVIKAQDEWGQCDVCVRSLKFSDMYGGDWHLLGRGIQRVIAVVPGYARHVPPRPQISRVLPASAFPPPIQ